MTDSDFDKKNGRQENRDFFSGRGMMFSALVESTTIGYYQALAQMFGWVYAKEVKITRWWWCAFIDLYISGLRIESCGTSFSEQQPVGNGLANVSRISWKR